MTSDALTSHAFAAERLVEERLPAGEDHPAGVAAPEAGAQECRDLLEPGPGLIDPRHGNNLRRAVAFSAKVLQRGGIVSLSQPLPIRSSQKTVKPVFGNVQFQERLNEPVEMGGVLDSMVQWWEGRTLQTRSESSN